MINDAYIELFLSLFQGRKDVFALRWEKQNKSGYMPAYSYDPYMYRLHKQKGGSFKDYRDKTFLKLDDFQITKHLDGRHFIGVYPLLQDNTSHFIVADFDKRDWENQSIKAIKALKKNRIPSYLERSQSGNGAHIWVFFNRPYAAKKSRSLLLTLFEKEGIFPSFDKNSSFDRLFPNQDYLSGKGLGNLIALPLQGTALKKGNSCFIDPCTFKPYADQWEFLKTIEKVAITHLDKMGDLSSILLPQNPIIERNHQEKKLKIVLNNNIKINRNGLTPLVISFLKDELNFYNSDFVIKKKIGRSTWQTDRFFNLIEESENSISIPSGFIGNLLRFCNHNSIDYEFNDHRKKLDQLNIQSSIQLLDHQKAPLEIALKKDFGVIVSPPGSGKTIIGLKLIEQKKQPALIITHRKQIAEQWEQRIESFFNIPKKEIGRIGQGKMKIGKQITVALIQSLGKKLDTNFTQLNTAFGIVIIDECHHVPAKSFRDTIGKLSCYYQYGLTATPFRKNNDEKLMFVFLGNIISEIKPTQIKTFKKARLIVRDTLLDIPFSPKTDVFETLSKVLIHDSQRNKLILKDVQKELDLGRKAVIITERKEHIQAIQQYLKSSYQVIAISGSDNKTSRSTKWNAIQNKDYQVIITTGQYFGEGIDIQDISCLFLVYPFAFKGKLIQYIGRIQRSEITPVVYDYRDKKISYLERLFLKRNTYYRNLDREATLFDDFIEEQSSSAVPDDINRTIKLLIENLEFHYGMVTFSQYIEQIKSNIEFEIENENIQPQFEVLKPYFSKIMESKYVSIRIHVGFENKKIVSQLATSKEIDCFNTEIFESLKFQFIEQIVRKEKSKNNLDWHKSAEQIDVLFGSENKLLETLLKNKQYIHSNQLRYLAKHHVSKIFKIRYTLSPFSFIFLLEGEQKNHIVLETLETKEATYIWHLSKSKEQFEKEFTALNQKLSLIRQHGRQTFLETRSNNFSKVIHDYSKGRKGFYKWKNSLEERLI